MYVPSPIVSSWSPLLLLGFYLKKCVPSFEVLNMVAGCLDDENEIPMKRIASFVLLCYQFLL